MTNRPRARGRTSEVGRGVDATLRQSSGARRPKGRGRPGSRGPPKQAADRPDRSRRRAEAAAGTGRQRRWTGKPETGRDGRQWDPSPGGRAPARRRSDRSEDEDGPPEERQPAGHPPRRADRPDRDRPGPPAQADPAGQPERAARQPALQRLPLVGRAAARRDRARRRLRHRRPAGAGAGAARPASPSPGSGRPAGPETDVLVGIAHDLAEAVVGSAAPPAGRRRTAWTAPRSRWWPSTWGRPSGSGRASGSSDWPATTWWRRSPPAPSPQPRAEPRPSWSGWPWPARATRRAPTARTTGSTDPSAR